LFHHASETFGTILKHFSSLICLNKALNFNLKASTLHDFVLWVTPETSRFGQFAIDMVWSLTTNQDQCFLALPKTCFIFKANKFANSLCYILVKLKVTGQSMEI
jgi:hypothetical protein